MSQASRSKVRARERWRRQAARLVVVASPLDWREYASSQAHAVDLVLRGGVRFERTTARVFLRGEHLLMWSHGRVSSSAPDVQTLGRASSTSDDFTLASQRPTA